MHDPFRYLTPAAHRLLFFARRQAWLCHAAAIGPEHVVAGALVIEPAIAAILRTGVKHSPEPAREPPHEEDVARRLVEDDLAIPMSRSLLDVLSDCIPLRSQTGSIRAGVLVLCALRRIPGLSVPANAEAELKEVVTPRDRSA